MRFWFGRNPLRLEIPGFTNVEEIAGGGFSTVYRADQPQLSRTVAIKVLNPRGLDKQDLFRRFERECKTLGMLGEHPNVVRVFEVGVSASGSPYIVMEYLPAGSLAGRLDADGPLPWEAVLAIGVKLAGALASAHQAGVLHLDVKPANLMVGLNSEPKLADFGIARVRAAVGVTTTQALVGGTPGYVAPELFEEDEPTTAADIFSLGTTLFTLLAGRSPFLRSPDEQARPEVIFGRTLFEPVAELGHGFPEGLRAVVRRAMAKSPADRYESAADLGEALQAVQRQNRLAVTPLLVVPVQAVEPMSPKRKPPSTPRRRLVMCYLVVLALIGGVGGVRVWRSPCSPISKPGDGVLSFGMLFPKTGSFAYQDPALEAGVDLGINDVAAAGGIPGIAVKFDDANRRDEGDPLTDTANKAADALLTGEVDVIIGAGTSAVTRKVIDRVVCAGVVMFSPANTASVFSTYEDHGFYFRSSPSNVFQGSVLGNLVVADGNSTVVVMARDDTYANDMRQITEQAIRNAGGRVLDSFSYNPNAPNHDKDIQRIKAQDPDAIILIGFVETGQILADMIEQGLGPQHKNVYGAGNVSNTLARQVNPRDPSILAGMKGVRVDAGDDAFSRRVKGINPGLQDFTYASDAYDAVVVTALAAAVAGTDAPVAIAEQINGVTRQGEKCMSFAACMALVREGRDIDYDGVSGPLEFTDTGEPSSGIYVISEFQADGSLKSLRTVTAGRVA